MKIIQFCFSNFLLGTLIYQANHLGNNNLVDIDSSLVCQKTILLDNNIQVHKILELQSIQIFHNNFLLCIINKKIIMSLQFMI